MVVNRTIRIDQYSDGPGNFTDGDGRPEIADNRAVFPDAATLARLEMMRDLDRHSRRVLNRLWTEIKLR
jgi:hypothetical protein